MCLAIPMKITKISGGTGTATADGIKKTINIQFLPELKTGDYVIVHAGFAIQKLERKEALKTLRIFRELAEKADEIHR